MRDLLVAVRESNSFQRSRLGCFIDPNAPLSSLPLTTKSEIAEDQRRNPPFGSNRTYSLPEYTRFSQTSGSTGPPIRWLDTTDSWRALVECWQRIYRVAGIGRNDAVFFAFSFGPFLGFWTAYDAAIAEGALCLPGGGMSSSARVQCIMDARATVLCCTPTYAIRLGETAREHGLDLSESAIRAILVAGEPGGSIPSVRAKIETLWPGARVWDHHGMTEVGPVSCECPVRAGILHVFEDAHLPEILDPETQRPVVPGEAGELVLTTLKRVASPLIRYRTGDLVRSEPQDGPCACGSCELSLVGGILGRVDDMVVVRGVNLYPSAVDRILSEFAAVAEYRVELSRVNAMDEVRLTIEPLPGHGEVNTLRESVATALRNAFQLRIEVSAVEPGSLPRFEMKARRWVRLPDETG